MGEGDLAGRNFEREGEAARAADVLQIDEIATILVRTPHLNPFGSAQGMPLPDENAGRGECQLFAE